MQLNGDAEHSWKDVAKRQPRAHSCHAALAVVSTEPTKDRGSHYSHQPSPLLAEIGEELRHSLTDVVTAREHLSMRWVEAYARSITRNNVVPGAMVFAKRDPSLPTIASILNEFCGAAK